MRGFLSNLTAHAGYALQYQGHMRRRRAREAEAHACGVKHAAELTFAEHVTGDTLFVLGSGASISSLDTAAWAEISAQNSIGFNNWIVHPFTPTFFAIEMASLEPREIFERSSENVFSNLQLSAERYAAVPLLFLSSPNRPFAIERVPASLRENLYWNREVVLRGASEAEVLRHLRFVACLGWLSPRRGYDICLAKRASLFRFVHFGVVAGYRRIVLCGIDLSSPEYFFDADIASYEARGYQLDHVRMLQRGPVHNTFDNSRGDLTIDRLLYMLREQVLLPRGVELFVASERSALHPRIPLYEFGKGPAA